MDGALPGAVNMARDHALALGLPDGAAALRLYRWEVPTLSLGRNEPARGRWSRERLRASGVALVRRPTGGRAVLHHRELTYAVALPAAALPPRRAYRWINERLAIALAGIGVHVEIAPRGPIAPPDAGPCFQEAAPGELVSLGRKLVGSAQARIRGPNGDVLLQHGSILLGDDQGLLDDLREPEDPGATRSGALEPEAPATIEGLLGRSPAAGELERSVLAAFGAVDGGELPAPELEARLEAKYRSDPWTWRR